MFTHYNPIYDEDLGVTRLYYLSKDKAREWRNKYIKLFHPDQGHNTDFAEEVAMAINKIYNRMVGDA